VEEGMRKLTVISLLLVVAIASSASTAVLAQRPHIEMSATTIVSTQTTTTTVTSYSAGNTTITTTGLDPSAGYQSSSKSVVTVEGSQVTTTVLGQQPSSVLGSGFVVTYSSTNYIITNFHVIDQVTNLTVTFSNGDAYLARVVGKDPYSDLAILSAQNVSPSEFHSLTLVYSTQLSVGQSVVAIGAPFGLSGTVTVGIISQIGRTIQDPTAGNFSIADAIQFTAPINPGNSGGPLLDSSGMVVGMTTAVLSGSQGLGFAIPSDTIIRELPNLIRTGGYNMHSLIGIQGSDMNYWLAKASGTNITYVVLIENLLPNSAAAKAGLKVGPKVETIQGRQYNIGGDIIVSMNGTKILNNDALATYLARFTLPGQIIQVGIIRSGSFVAIPITLAERPPIA
jgi:S1-C subfamily serine protease